MGFLIFIGVLLLLGLPVASLIIALIASQRANRQYDRLRALERHVFALESQLRQLTAQSASSRAGPAVAPPPESAAQRAAAPAETLRPALEASTLAASTVPIPAPAPAMRVAPAPAVASVATTPAPVLAAAAPAGAASPVPTGAKAEDWLAGIQWEQFMGAKLFAWVGGFALFLAVAFSVKYAFQEKLISPPVQVALGFLTGLGLLVGGIVLKKRAYEVTAQTLCGTGVVILYAISFASHSYYHLTGMATSFALMVLVTVTAFLLAVRLNALVVAVLGLVGGFLTPPMLSTGVDRPLALFGYIAILDVGLIAVALRRRWQFLLGIAALGTVMMQLGWVSEFFAVPKVFVALAVFLGFNVVFLVPALIEEKHAPASRWSVGAAVGMPLVTLGFVWWLIDATELGARPGVIFSFLLGADLCVLFLVLRRLEVRFAHAMAGAAVFLLLADWSGGHLTKELLPWALGGYLGLAVLHTAFPVLLQRRHPQSSPLWLGHLFAPAALVLAMIPLFKELAAPWLLWPVVLLIDVAAMVLTLLSGALAGILAVLVLTILLLAIWLGTSPPTLSVLSPMLIVTGGFALFFFVVGGLTTARMAARPVGPGAAGSAAERATAAGALAALRERAELVVPVPALGAIMPFLLLIMTALQLPLTNPSPVYGLAFLLVVLLLGLTRLSGVNVLAPVGLGCVLALECAWHQAHFSVGSAITPLLWNVGFAAVFLIFPFCFRRTLAGNALPWATAALSGPLHFYLVHGLVKQAFPTQFMGLLPAAFAVPVALALAVVFRTFVADAPNRRTVLAWFGASTLFFVTLIFPIQFERQWITLGWALEGLALIWLYRRLDHEGLRVAGVALLTTAFVRLAFNPAVLSYHPRSETRILNWFLYSYGLVSVCLMLGAWLLAPPRHLLKGLRLPALLYSLGTILVFLLLNLEIADYFSSGTTVTFAFSGDRARDMTYSIAWALFALALLVVGVWQRQAAARYAGLALLGITLLKLFLHDLIWLGALYRIGAFLGVAVISIVASVVYQKFFAAEARAPAN